VHQKDRPFAQRGGAFFGIIPSIRRKSLGGKRGKSTKE